MIQKPAPLEHVKFVRSRGRWYAYFNTGRKVDGKTVYARLPIPGTVGFWDSYAAFRASRTKRASAPSTVAQLAQDFMDSLEYASKADGTQRLYKIQLAKAVAQLGAFPMNDLLASDVRDAIDAEKMNPATRNAFVSAIGAMYGWARKRGKTELTPTRDIERVRGGEHEPWPDDVLEAGLTAEDARVRLAVHLLYYTGQRIGDVIAMRWNDIQGDVIHVRQKKTAKALRVPLHRELRAELARTPRTGITILSGPQGEPLRTTRLRSDLQRFTRAHGAATVPHGLRKNAVNTMLELGCSIAEVSAITGQTFAMVQHYAARINTHRTGDAAMLKFETRTKAVKESAGKTSAQNGANA